MSIPVTCQCGQRFMAQPHLAGQFVKCPVCGQGINVPIPQAVYVPPSVPQAYVPPAYAAPPAAQYAPPPQAAPAYGRPAPPQKYQSPQRSGAGPLMYVGIAGAVLLLLLIGAVAALMIGYDLAKTAFKRPAKSDAVASKPVVSPASADTPAPAVSPAPEKKTSESPATPSFIPSLPPVPSLPSVPSILAGGWQAHSSDVAKYSINFPGKIETGIPGSAFGAPPPGANVVEQVGSRTTDGTAAMVSVADLPAVMPDFLRETLLDEVAKGMARTTRGKNEKIERVTAGAYTGRDIRVTSETFGERKDARVQIFEVQGRLYLLFWVSPEGQGTNSSEPFFSSFKLLPGAGNPTAQRINFEPGAGLPFDPSFPPVPDPGRSRQIFGPVVVFQMLDFRGTGDAAAAAKRALAGIAWSSGAVEVDQAAGEIVVGVRGQSVNTGAATAALEASGFKIGTTAYKPRGR